MKSNLKSRIGFLSIYLGIKHIFYFKIEESDTIIHNFGIFRFFFQYFAMKENVDFWLFWMKEYLKYLNIPTLLTKY